jgi:hypothetical protein
MLFFGGERRLTVMLRLIVAMVLFVGVGVAAAPQKVLAAQNAKPEKAKADPISGNWNAVFTVDENVVPAKFVLKLEGNKITGTVISDYTGAGKISDGTWSEGKLTMTFEFTSHEAVALKGGLDHGKLSGDFATEGRAGKWTAEMASAPNGD